jgi:hypothetical protein
MSAIDTTQIDGAFPIAGQDNNSQGFRDNFTNIKNALNVAESEITTLELNTAKLNADNDFNGQILQNAEINKFYGSVRNNGPVSINTSVNVENGPLQIYTIGDDITLQFIQWPASDRYAKIKLHLKSDGTERIVKFVTEAGSNNVMYATGFPLDGSDKALTLADTQAYQVVEAWTFDGGIFVYMQYLGEFSE